ncbi:MAG: hypothetical protein VYE28_09485, partial [Planctomycetota bacterium]|nr:hypothetical protein [Planctomycetota bacterium]
RPFFDVPKFVQGESKPALQNDPPHRPAKLGQDSSLMDLVLQAFVHPWSKGKGIAPECSGLKIRRTRVLVACSGATGNKVGVL